jgi:hypothetical protein
MSPGDGRYTKSAFTFNMLTMIYKKVYSVHVSSRLTQLSRLSGADQLIFPKPRVVFPAMRNLDYRNEKEEG